MSKSRIFTSQICLLTLFAKIKFSRKFPNLQYLTVAHISKVTLTRSSHSIQHIKRCSENCVLPCTIFHVGTVFFLSVINARTTEEFRVSSFSQKHSQKIFVKLTKISPAWHNDRNGIEPAPMVGYRSWLLFLIVINDLLDMFCILFAFSQTLLSCEGKTVL